MTRLDVAGLAGLVRARPPRAGSTRVVVVDGFSGAGKTTLANRLAAALGAPLVHGEDVVPGWDGLAAGVRHVSDGLLEPLARGEPGRLRRWDWHRGEPDGEVVVPPAPLLVVEGSGLLAVPARHLVATGIWLEVPPAERSARLDARADDALYRPHRARWAAQEQELARRGGAGAADLVLVDEDEDEVTLLDRTAGGTDPTAPAASLTAVRPPQGSAAALRVRGTADPRT